MEKFIVIKHSRSLYNTYYGPFDSTDDAWDWINKTDRYRSMEWTVHNLENVN